MKNAIALVVLSVVIGCTEESPSISAQNSNLCRSVLISPDLPYDHEYDLKLSVEDLGNGEYNLVSIIDFHNGAFMASPFADEKLKGRFRITLHENDDVTMAGSFEEIPRSTERIDDFGHLVNWVNTRTTYKKSFKVNSEEYFKVTGMVSFTIEPTCTFEEIPFEIFYADGELLLQQYPKLDKRTCGLQVLEVSMYDSPLIDHEVAINHPYDVDFNVEKSENGSFNLVALIQLHGGSFFVSPNAGPGFSGKFRIEIATNDNLSIGSDFVETPRTKTVLDPHRFVHDPVNWVTEDTRYDYPLILNTEEDFEIGGKLIFVTEPKCTLEEIPIIFKFEDGELKVEKWDC